MNKQPVMKILILKLLKTMVKSSAFKFQKVTKSALFDSSVIFPKISHFSAAVRDSPVLDTQGSLKTRISRLVKHLCI